MKLVLTVLALFGINAVLSYVHKKCYTVCTASRKVGIRQGIAAAVKPVVDRLMLLSLIVFALVFVVYSAFPEIFTIVPTVVGYLTSAYNILKGGLDIIIGIIDEIKGAIEDLVDMFSP